MKIFASAFAALLILAAPAFAGGYGCGQANLGFFQGGYGGYQQQVVVNRGAFYSPRFVAPAFRSAFGYGFNRGAFFNRGFFGVNRGFFIRTPGVSLGFFR